MTSQDGNQGRVVPVMKFDQSFLRGVISSSAPSTYANRPAPDDELPGYVEPALASGAHLVWKEGDHAIYLGDRRCVATLESLRQGNIGAVVNCTKRVPCQYRQNQMRYCQVGVNDTPAADILFNLDGATSFIQTCLSSSSVLVHCEAGVSRSATVVLAYLMRFHGMTRDEAYLHVKRRRPQIEPNHGFWCQLLINQDQLAPQGGELCVLEKTRPSKQSQSRPVDSDWAKESSSTFLLCRDVMASTDALKEHCFANIKGMDPEKVIFICLDYIWGRGIISSELDWLAAACVVLDEKLHGDASVRIVEKLLTSKDSEFNDIWCGEVYPEQVELVMRALKGVQQ